MLVGVPDAVDEAAEDAGERVLLLADVYLAGLAFGGGLGGGGGGGGGGGPVHIHGRRGGGGPGRRGVDATWRRRGANGDGNG